MTLGHIPDGDLILYAFSTDALPLNRRLDIEQHTAVCVQCQAALDFFSVAEDDLADSDVWERVVGSATYRSLMEYAERIAAEDDAAASLLADFLDSPATAAWETLATRRRFHTGGVVRKLNAHAHELVENDALAALTFADAAVSVAEILPDDLYPAKAIYQLRGTAWKERAIAQMFLGELPAALESLTRAERAYRHLATPALGLAMVALIRAGVLYEQQRLDDAGAFALEAEQAFFHLGDKRRVDALFLRGAIKYAASDLDAAVSIFRQVLDRGEETVDPYWIARASHGIGIAEVDRGNLSEASLHLHRALVIFRELGAEPHRVATEWGIARVVRQSGKYHEAIRRLRDVAAEFELRGLVTDAALVGLDIADVWLALKEPNQVVELAQHIFSVFTDAGMITGALAAVAYLKEAAAERRLTAADIDTVRKFVQRAARNPALKFVPPPRLLVE